MTQLREHFVAGRLSFDELTERIDAALTAKTQRQIETLMADLPRPPRTARRILGADHEAIRRPNRNGERGP